jgi:tetratricopeptide (TPR) repeat protein
MTPDQQSPALARAEALLLANRPEDALRELATLPAGDAVGARAFELRCAALLDLERWTEAVDAARSGLAAGGPDPDLLRMLGRAEHELGRLETAERALLDGLALAPSDVRLLCAYARLCIAAGQLPKATRLVERAAAEQPHAAVVYATRAELAYARGDDRAAQQISREFVAEYPESPVAHALLGGTSAERGQVNAAYAGLRQAAAAEPTTRQYADAALSARIARHPLLLPVRPVIRFGVVKTWLVAVAVIFGLRLVGLPMLSFVAAMVWLALCVYSWTVPPLVSRWMKRRWR